MRPLLPCFALMATLLWTPFPASSQETPDQTPGDLFAEGYRHLTGQGVPKDATRAAASFLEAARMGEPQAQFQLGIMFMDGLAVPRDLLWAWFWLDRAHDHPDLPDAARQLAQGRLATATLLLTADQKRRLGIN
ncbi:tetratricopeptide repeat protein [Fundidesulfovibrio putealis]|uniref:tetratricopeptide repeat protein n=1 Tax=Fundidesulfovibrio putealis TaxID=270496 RepID=UPI0005B98F8D|nr:SEL1-like repeat protein [Fundidesulfovibrio putealis]